MILLLTIMYIETETNSQYNYVEIITITLIITYGKWGENKFINYK